MVNDELDRLRAAVAEVRKECEYVAKSPNGWCGDAIDWAPDLLAILDKHAVSGVEETMNR